MTDKSSKPGQELFKFFESKDPVYYDSFEFRRKLRDLFESRVRAKVDGILKIPEGSRWDNPDIDNVTDDTFEKCQKSLDSNRIAQGLTPEIRCYTCWAFMLLVAQSVATDFVRKNGRPWSYEEYTDELLLVDPTQPDSGCDSGLDLKTIRNFLARYIRPEDLEMFFLRHAEGLPPREINERYKHLSANHIRVKLCRTMAVVRDVLTPAVIEQLKRKK
jgi:DNA-directed RNA polymerase specialized sigma24 family protein